MQYERKIITVKQKDILFRAQYMPAANPAVQEEVMNLCDRYVVTDITGNVMQVLKKGVGIEY